jgi:hypothetical protein
VRLLTFTLIGLLCWFVPPPAFAEDDPDYAAMIDDDGKDFAYLVCSDCHAMQHVLQKRYSRRGWRDAMKRMTHDFGMAELEAEETVLILDYLVKHYSPGSGR